MVTKGEGVLVTGAELEADLWTVADVENVRIFGVGDELLCATVLASSFEGKDEAERQAAVWSLLRARHGGQRLKNVALIFTFAPSDSPQQFAPSPETASPS